MLSKDRCGVAAGEYEGVVFILVPFEVGDDIIGGQPDARIGADLAAVGHGEHGAGNLVFEKRFQILEQAHPVHGIHGHDGYFFCHDCDSFNGTMVIFSKFITFAYKYRANHPQKQERT